MPRVECQRCGRPIAAGPVAGRFGRGRVWRHDAPGQRRKQADGSLVSCPGSLAIIDLPTPAQQLELGDDLDDQEHAAPERVAALF